MPSNPIPETWNKMIAWVVGLVAIVLAVAVNWVEVPATYHQWMRHALELIAVVSSFMGWGVITGAVKAQP